MKKSKLILVTGGGGFLGSAIVRKLAERGDRVRSLARNFYPDIDLPNVEQVRGDIGDRECLMSACRGVDAVIHAAARAGAWGDYRDYYRTNVTGTENVIEACRRNNVAALVHTSTPSVVIDGRDICGADESIPHSGKHHSHYPATKALAEAAVLDAARQGLPALILRPHVIWGPGDNHLVPRIVAKARRIVRIGDGENLVDTIYVDNAADAHIMAADRLMKDPSLAGNVYYICQNEPVKLWALVNMILTWAGFAPVSRSISLRAARAAAAVMEAAYRLLRINDEPLLTRYVVDELGTSHWFDVSAATRDLGFAPAVSMQEGLRRTEEWVRSVYAQENYN
jgi:2-alkyl-3-oxoalkanoate reductase